jgi:DNA-binding transcriptional regulator YiaG
MQVTSEHIKNIRLQVGFTQNKAAHLMDITLHQWRLWENGKVVMPLETLKLFFQKAKDFNYEQLEKIMAA